MEHFGEFHHSNLQCKGNCPVMEPQFFQEAVELVELIFPSILQDCPFFELQLVTTLPESFSGEPYCFLDSTLAPSNKMGIWIISGIGYSAFLTIPHFQRVLLRLVQEFSESNFDKTFKLGHAYIHANLCIRACDWEALYNVFYYLEKSGQTMPKCCLSVLVFNACSKVRRCNFAASQLILTELIKNGASPEFPVENGLLTSHPFYAAVLGAAEELAKDVKIEVLLNPPFAVLPATEAVNFLWEFVEDGKIFQIGEFFKYSLDKYWLPGNLCKLALYNRVLFRKVIEASKVHWKDVETSTDCPIYKCFHFAYYQLVDEEISSALTILMECALPLLQAGCRMGRILKKSEDHEESVNVEMMEMEFSEFPSVCDMYWEAYDGQVGTCCGLGRQTGFLQKLCRKTILKTLPLGICNRKAAIDGLNLPFGIAEFLKFAEFASLH